MNTNYVEWHDVEDRPLGEWEDESRGVFELKAGYESERLFIIEHADGEKEFVAGSISECGELKYSNGDHVGWEWSDVSRWAFLDSFAKPLATCASDEYTQPR